MENRKHPPHKSMIERLFSDAVSGLLEGDRRVQERAVAQVTAAMCRGWLPPEVLLERLAGPAVNRAGYWFDLAASWATDEIAHKLYALSVNLRPRACREAGARFYAGEERRNNSGADELAKMWFLEAGVGVSDLRQSMQNNS